MKRSGRLLVLVAFGIAAIGAVFWAMNRGPRHQGKRLSEWLQIGYHSGDAEERQMACTAIQHIGTNALPYLIKEISYEPSKSRKRALLFARRVPPALGGEILIELLGGDWEQRSHVAEFGFQALGPSGESAVPLLAGLLTQTNPVVCRRAMHALAGLGKAGVPPLLAMLKDERHPSRSEAALYIVVAYRISGDMESGMPVITVCLHDKSAAVVASTLMGLGGPRIRPDAVTPMLIELTRHSDSNVRFWAINCLSQFGNREPAEPAIEECLLDSDVRVRRAATNALRTVPGISRPVSRR